MQQQRSSTLFLRFALLVLGLIVIAIPTAMIYGLSGPGWAKEMPQFAYMQYPFLTLVGISGIVCIVAIIQSYKLLGLIDSNTAFSTASVRALRNIKICALVVFGLWWLCMPAVYAFAEIDDAPGAIVIGAAFATAPVVVAVFAAVLQKLVKSAIQIKSENDLTV